MASAALQLTDSNPFLLKSSSLHSGYAHRRIPPPQFRLIPRASSSSSSPSDKARRHLISAAAAAAVTISLVSVQLQESPAISKEPLALSERERVYFPIDPNNGFLLGTGQHMVDIKHGGNTCVPRSIPLAEDEDYNSRFNSISFQGKEGRNVRKPAFLLYTSDAGESMQRVTPSAQLPADLGFAAKTQTTSRWNTMIAACSVPSTLLHTSGAASAAGCFETPATHVPRSLSAAASSYMHHLLLADLDPATAKTAIGIMGPCLSAFGFLFIVRIVMSWYPKLPVGKFPYVVAYAPTEPILRATRKLIPPLGGVDVTPVVWFGLISFLNEILVGPQGLLVLLSQQIQSS